MRPEDFERLSVPYESGDPNGRDDAFADVIGAGVPSIRALLADLLTDLDVGRFGIGWWTSYPELGTKRRILISDQLYLCVYSIERNLAEAYLHDLEAKEQHEIHGTQLARSCAVRENGLIAFRHPDRTRPSDDLPGRLGTLHIAGFFRGLVSAIDCLGGAIVGVAGLPLPILKADMSVALRWLAREKAPSPRQRELGEALRQIICAAGPTGWFDWAIDYRNMLVHRGRRLQGGRIDIESHLVDLQGKPVLKSVPVLQLATDPALSDVEAFLAWKDGDPVLGEDADVTMTGLLASTKATLAKTGTLLLDLWHERRANPPLIVQPSQQWPKVPSGPSSGFRGYRQTRPSAPQAMATNPAAVKRLQAAALGSPNRARWAAFD
ncbi:MAG: hypothetical protein ACLP66_03385 [Polyangia bacterium]|jgi:hypothetical protein